MSFHLNDIKGGWAVVTGASAGIGRAYALALARHGMNLVLVARRQAELEAVAAEARTISGMAAQALALDLAAPGAAAQVLQVVQQAEASVRGSRLRLLVSNAGSGRWGAHDAAQLERYAEVLSLNVNALVALTTTLLPTLQANPPSAVVHVSSQAAYQPVPYMAVYGASKAFVHHFSLALHEELRGQGVLVQTLVPGPTATEFDAKAGAYESKVVQRGSPDAVVQASLAALNRGDAVATNASGIWKQRLFAGLAPPAMVVREVGKMFAPPKG